MSKPISRRKLAALLKVADYIVDCENAEYDNYTEWCEENGLDPKDIKGKEQSKNVYALALIGLGFAYPVKTCPICNAVDCKTHN